MSFSFRRLCGAVLLTMISLSLAGSVYADAAGVKKALDEAQEHIKSKRWSDAEANLTLAETELEDVPAAEKSALEKSITAARKSIENGRGSAELESMKTQIKDSIDGARKSITSPKSAESQLNDAEKLLNGEDGKKLIKGADRTAFEADIAKLRKATSKLVGEADAADIERLLKFLEGKQAEVMPQLKEEAADQRPDVQNFSRNLEEADAKIKALAPENPKTKDLIARYKKVADPFNAGVAQGDKNEVLAQLKRSRESYQDESKGWEQETDSPTWDEYMKEQSESMGAWRQIKTTKFVDRANQFLKDTAENERVKAMKDDADVKAFIADVSKQRDAAVAKLVKAAEKLLDGAEKANLDQDTAVKAGSFKEAIRVNLDGAPQQEALQARAQAINDKFYGNKKAGEEAADKEVATLIEEVKKNWPGLVSPLQAADFPDPASVQKGKLYSLKGYQNRAGAELEGGEYDFVVKINGKPVAAKYDPAVRAALEDARTRLHYSVDDTEEIVMEIVGTCNVQEREYLQFAQKWSPTFMHKDVPLGKIVAYRQGPIGVVVGSGGVKSISSSGTVDGVAGGAATGSTGSGAGAWFWRFLTLLVGLTAAAAALLKANFAPIASVPQIGQVRTKLGDTNFAYLGLALAGLGLIWWVSGWFIYGALTSLAIIAAGLYVALDFLVAKGLVKEPLAAKIRPLGVPIGLACAALAVLSLLTAGMLRII